MTKVQCLVIDNELRINGIFSTQYITGVTMMFQMTPHVEVVLYCCLPTLPPSHSLKGHINMTVSQTSREGLKFY